MATARSPGPPHPDPPVAENPLGTARLRRTRSLPGALGVPVPPGAPTPPPVPPPALADLRRLMRGAAGGAHGALPPLLASLPRRPPNPPPTPNRGGPAPPPPAPRPWVPPRRVDAEGVTVTLRPHPALCRDAGEAAPDPLGLRELYRELGRTLPPERLHFHRDPPVEPAADADLLPAGGQRGRRKAGRPPRRQSARLGDDYLEFVAATGSDFLGAVFHRDGGDQEPVGAPWVHREPAGAPWVHREPVLAPVGAPWVHREPVGAPWVHREPAPAPV